MSDQSKESKRKKPFYGLRTKRRVIEEYFYSSASLEELSEIHGILGSNTVTDWLRKYGNLRPSKFLNTPIMPKSLASPKDKANRQKKYKTSEQLYLSELQADLETEQQRLRFYSLFNNIVFKIRGVTIESNIPIVINFLFL